MGEVELDLIMNESAENRGYFGRPGVAEAWGKDSVLYPVERQVVTAHFPARGARVLDVGCGSGRTTAALLELGFNVTACDYSPEMVAVARARLPTAAILHMDARALAFSDHSFDVAMFSFNGLDALHPVHERRLALREIVRVLTPGGLLYFSGHNWMGQLGRFSGEHVKAEIRRKLSFWRAQRLAALREGYGVYRDEHGEQTLFHQSPFAQIRELSAWGLTPVAIYASVRFKTEVWRQVRVDRRRRSANLLALLGASIRCPHIHYVFEV